jgi:hypothetical protein
MVLELETTKQEIVKEIIDMMELFNKLTCVERVDIFDLRDIKQRVINRCLDGEVEQFLNVWTQLWKSKI